VETLNHAQSINQLAGLSDGIVASERSIVYGVYSCAIVRVCLWCPGIFQVERPRGFCKRSVSVFLKYQNENKKSFCHTVKCDLQGGFWHRYWWV